MRYKTLYLIFSIGLLLWACQGEEITPDDFTITQEN